MSREKLLSSYELHKLVEKVEDNFSDFYKIFCDGVMYALIYLGIMTIKALNSR